MVLIANTLEAFVSKAGATIKVRAPKGLSVMTVGSIVNGSVC
jgi:hypothetical protein